MCRSIGETNNDATSRRLCATASTQRGELTPVDYHFSPTAVVASHNGRGLCDSLRAEEQWRLRRASPESGTGTVGFLVGPWHMQQTA